MNSKILHYETQETSSSLPWMVFIHGAGGSMKTWRRQTAAFSDRFNILLLDLRDHGASKNLFPNPLEYTFDLISNDIKEVLDDVGIERAHFMVLSFGSVLIQDFYDRYPSYVERIIAAGGVFGGTLRLRGFVAAARFFNLFLSYRSMYSLFSYVLMPRKRHQMARKVYQMHATMLTQKEYMKWVGLYDHFFFLLDKFRKQELMVPMHIVMGGDDYVFLKEARSFAKNQPNVTLDILPEVGHICNIEAHEQFNHVVLEALPNPDFARLRKVSNG